MSKLVLILTLIISACTWIHTPEPYTLRSPSSEAALCRVKNKKDTSSPALSIAERKDCVRNGHVLLDPPKLSLTDLQNGPPAKLQIHPNKKVYCRFDNHYSKKKSEGYDIGDSLKFRCLLTDEKNQLIRADGSLIHAQEESQAIEIKVKYIDGNSLTTMKERHREGFIEIAASRIFWALGVPADRMYPAQSVVCFGCAADPFPNQKVAAAGFYEFIYPAIEIKFPGDEISIGKKSKLRLPLAGGKSVEVTESEWSWKELEDNYASYSHEERLNYEAFLLFANWIGYRNPAAYQNRLQCLKGSLVEPSSICRKPVLLVQDIGATFGDKGFLGQNPRGDYSAFFHSSVFKNDDVSTCMPEANLEGPEVSEAGRLYAVERLKNLGRQELEVIFKIARFDQVDQTYRKKIQDSFHGKLSEDELSEKVIQGWVDLMEKRKEEIFTHRCKH